MVRLWLTTMASESESESPSDCLPPPIWMEFQKETKEHTGVRTIWNFFVSSSGCFITGSYRQVVQVLLLWAREWRGSWNVFFFSARGMNGCLEWKHVGLESFSCYCSSRSCLTWKFLKTVVNRSLKEYSEHIGREKYHKYFKKMSAKVVLATKLGNRLRNFSESCLRKFIRTSVHNYFYFCGNCSKRLAKKTTTEFWWSDTFLLQDSCIFFSFQGFSQ